MKLHTICVLSLGLLCAGCSSLWPKYERPIINAPQKWPTIDSQTHVQHTTISTLAWWENFHDPELNQLIHNALVHNNNLHTAYGNIKQAQAALQKVQSNWLPSMALGGSTYDGQLNNFTVTNGTGTSLLDTFGKRSTWPYNGYTAGFVPMYTLNILSQIKADKIAVLQVDIAKEIRRAVQLTIVSQTAASYFTLIGLKKQLKLQYQLCADLEEIRRYVLIQYKQGAAPITNVYMIDQNIATVKKDIPTIQDGITQAENAINVLSNKNPGPIHTRVSFDQISANGVIPVNIPVEVIRHRPDIVISEYQLEISNHTIGEIAGQFFPTMNLSAFWGNAALSFVDFFTGASILQAELSAGLNVINIGILADIKRAKAAKYSAYYNYIQAIRNAFSEVDDGLSNHVSVNKHYQQQAVAVSNAKKQYQMGMFQYQQGSVSYASTLNSKFNVDYALAELNQDKLQQLNSIVHLYLALGGGAVTNPPPKKKSCCKNKPMRHVCIVK